MNHQETQAERTRCKLFWACGSYGACNRFLPNMLLFLCTSTSSGPIYREWIIDLRNHLVSCGRLGTSRDLGTFMQRDCRGRSESQAISPAGARMQAASFTRDSSFRVGRGEARARASDCSE